MGSRGLQKYFRNVETTWSLGEVKWFMLWDVMLTDFMIHKGEMVFSQMHSCFFKPFLYFRQCYCELKISTKFMATQQNISKSDFQHIIMHNMSHLRTHESKFASILTYFIALIILI